MQAIKPLLQSSSQSLNIYSRLTPEKICQSFFLNVCYINSIVNGLAGYLFTQEVNSGVVYIIIIKKWHRYNIGFVINEQYFTIRTPNYQGIKDLLNRLKVSDNVDFTNTLICLRNSITAELKKLKQAKLTLFVFSSNVAEDKDIPMKANYRKKINLHLPDHRHMICKIRRAIRQYCIDSQSYVIGYVKMYNNEKDGEFCTSMSDRLDTSLLYELMSTTARQGIFQICNSKSTFSQKMQAFSSLILYQFHQFYLMVPVKNDYVPEFMQDNIKLQKMKEECMQQRMMSMQQPQQHNKDMISQQQSQQLDAEDSDKQDQFMNQQERQNPRKYIRISLTNVDQTKFSTSCYIFLDRREIDLDSLHKNGYYLTKSMSLLDNERRTKQDLKFAIKKKVIKKLEYIFKHQYQCKQIIYRNQPNMMQEIECKVQYFKRQLNQIIKIMIQDIIKYKRRYIGNKKYQYYIEINEYLQFRLRERVVKIQSIAKDTYNQIFDSRIVQTQRDKRMMFELYSSLKIKIDATNQVLMNLFKKQIRKQDIGNLSRALNFENIRNSMRRKLIKRVNSNPTLIDDTYNRVQHIYKSQLGDLVDIEAKNKIKKSAFGNCMYTFDNFVGALKNRDCLALIFEIERPDTAIADPGRIKIRQVSTMVTTVSKFFQIHQYGITESWQSVAERYEQKIFLDQANRNAEDQFFGINKAQYKQKWDYWNKVASIKTCYGIMPLYICAENWKISKLLMKLCLAWTACKQPMAYCYSQYETIPFMVLSSLIKTVQQAKYRLEQIKKQAQKYTSYQQFYSYNSLINSQRHKKQRYQQLQQLVQQTCDTIMKELSTDKYEQKLIEKIIKKYENYRYPINRTIDLINNNSSFLGQLYTVLKMSPKVLQISELNFHQFFKRLVQEELRRETDGWKQQQIEQIFQNKLLNAKTQLMDKPEYIVLNSVYKDRFEQALKGGQVYRTQFQIQRTKLQMMLKENNKFNDFQRLTIIEYKRLYENRVLWMWYVRFKLYGQIDRIKIHKWKSLDLLTSYSLFTMIIQNKKQRKNRKRRQAILDEIYVDPFDYNASREYLEMEFIKLRNRKQVNNIVLLTNEKYSKAAQAFSQSKDLQQAAGALLNTSQNQQIVFFYKQLLHDAKLIQQKLKMLLNGQYKGIQLMNHGWKMSKKKTNLLRRKYPLEFQRYQFMF